MLAETLGGRIRQARQAVEAKFSPVLAEDLGCCKLGVLRVIWRENQHKKSVADLWQTKTCSIRVSAILSGRTW